MSQMDLVELKKALPRNLQSAATQELLDKVNNVSSDEVIAEEVRNNFLTYAKVLTEGRYKTEDYLNAVAYCTFKIMGYTNKDSYAKAFPDRYLALVSRGASAKEISAYVAMYHKNKLVNTILEQSVIPSWLLNQDNFQRAINTQVELMSDPTVNARDRTAAANSLLTHLKAPEVSKVQLDVNVKQDGGINDLRATMVALATQQRELIAKGMGAKQLVQQPLSIDAIEGEFTTCE
ncbi:MAG: hypothetical protein ACOH2T_19215 [Pseudomonas sp.]